MIEAKDHTLNPKEVSQLIKDGVDLKPDGNHMYLMRFGWNNEMNQAADPAPFKIEKHLNPKLRQDALGMPYVVPPYGQTKHVRKRKDEKHPQTVQEQLEAILKVQSDFAIGEIQGSLEYDTGNVWLIIDVWPEFQAGVERGYYPPLVSPTFNLIDVDENGIVNDAQFLNLQTVPTSGYSPEYTQIESVCKNGIKECMMEMAVHGAAGTLEQARKDGISFSSTKSKENQTMEESEIQAVVDKVIPAVEEKIQEQVVKPLEEVKAEVSEIKKMEDANAEVLLEVATKTDGVDEKKVVTKDSTTDSSSETSNPDSAVSGAAGNQQILKLQNELNTVKGDVKKFSKIADDAEKKLKEAHVTSIIERKFRGKKLEEAEKTKVIAEYMKKDVDVLETIDNELKAAIPESSENSGISGAYGLYKPDSTTSNTDRPKNSEMFS